MLQKLRPHISSITHARCEQSFNRGAANASVEMEDWEREAIRIVLEVRSFYFTTHYKTYKGHCCLVFESERLRVGERSAG